MLVMESRWRGWNKGVEVGYNKTQSGGDMGNGNTHAGGGAGSLSWEAVGLAVCTVKSWHEFYLCFTSYLGLFAV